MEENPGNRVSAETISSITDRILPELQFWRSRPLDSVYPVVWMDAVHYKVIDEKNRPVTRAIYHVLGVDRNGYKDLLGMYISKSEGANFWLSVLTDLQSRGGKRHSDSLYGQSLRFSDAIRRIIYTTNTVEGYHRQIRKVTKNKGVFQTIRHWKSWFIRLIATSARNGQCHSLIGDKPLNNWLLNFLIDLNFSNDAGNRYFL